MPSALAECGGGSDRRQQPALCLPPSPQQAGPAEVPCHQNAGGGPGSLPGLDSVPTARLPSSPPWGTRRHLPLLSGAGWEKALSIFHLHLPRTKNGKCQRREKIQALKAKQGIAIRQLPWQSPRLPGRAVGSSLQVSTRVGIGLCIFEVRSPARTAGDLAHEKVVAQLGSLSDANMP